MEKQLIPEPQPKAFVQDIENNYPEDRYSEVSHGDHREPKTVQVVSAEHPAFTRFLADIKPYLYHHGFALSSVRKDYMVSRSDKDINHGYHSVKGVSIQWIVAEAQGYTCNRGACTRLAHPEDGWYCEYCDPKAEKRRIEEEQRSIFA